MFLISVTREFTAPITRLDNKPKNLCRHYNLANLTTAIGLIVFVLIDCICVQNLYALINRHVCVYIYKVAK